MLYGFYPDSSFGDRSGYLFQISGLYSFQRITRLPGKSGCEEFSGAIGLLGGDWCVDFGQEQFGSQSIDERLSVLFRNGGKLLSLFLVHCRLFPEKLCDDMGWVHSPFSAAGVYVLACQGEGNTAVRSFRISSWSAILVLFFRWMVLYPSSLQFGAINVSLRSDGFAAEYPERICTLDRSGSRAGFFIDLDNSFSFWVVRTLVEKTAAENFLPLRIFMLFAFLLEAGR